ncbi:DHH family phosphoesterase [Aquibacillus albus]|uniref:Oligoribonuclease NrnB/cAMP/cGMP phosphodiesterase (DHH superfamily) n=1 Tax=Aquibacillus albus TaxID=1168171 RepID=A0ABS2MYA7_9BACI|nr:oligoribonuclease [Aquibacillus albus]MBM7570867.1 oligoribonuclease NrnB/cAMP/cGMP phosphodiesterase (DHH superfamily) [Aquibacillus albus]
MYKLLSHNDLDGVGCGIIAKLAFGDQVQVRYNSISGLNREVEYFLENHDSNTFLMITDLSVNEENEKRLEEYYQDKGGVQLLDHHKTALSFNDYDWGKVVVQNQDGTLTSATSLLYEYLLSQELMEPSNVIEEFVELVRQYDTWEWEKNDNQKAKRLNTLFFLMSINDFEEKMVNRLRTSEHFHFDEFELKLLEMEEKNIERYIRRKRRELVQTELGEHYAGVVYAESYHSELGNELGKEYPHLDYIVILNIGGKRMGFRTIHDGVDVSEVAGLFGGGGHEKASGAILTEEAYKQFVAKTFVLEPLKEDAKRNRFNQKDSSFGTLYKDRSDNIFLLYQRSEREWAIEKNHEDMEKAFSSFDEAEIFLKRKYQAWLERDEAFVSYLIHEVNKKKTESSS